MSNPFVPDDDFYADEVERRFQQELEYGGVLDGMFRTRSGARVPMFEPRDDDDELVDPGCVYCDGYGEWHEDDRSGFCNACRGTGAAGHMIPRGLQRKENWLDMIFFADAPRFENMDRDICPDCGAGGCGGECHWTAEEYALYTGA